MPSLTPTMGGSVLWPETTVLSRPFVRFSLSFNRVSSVITIGFLFTMFHLAILVLYRLSLSLVWLRFRWVLDSSRYLVFSLITALNAARFSFWSFRVYACLFFGFVLSLGFFFTYMIFWELVSFPTPNMGNYVLTRNECTAYAFCTPVSPLQQSVSMITICFFFSYPLLLGTCAIDRVTGHYTTHAQMLFSFCSFPVGSTFAALHVVVFSFMLASSATVFWLL